MENCDSFSGEKKSTETNLDISDVRNSRQEFQSNYNNYAQWGKRKYVYHRRNNYKSQQRNRN